MVDHLVPHKGDKILFEKTGNHLSLCAKCHNTVTSKFDTKYVVGQTIEPKTQWMNSERQRNEISMDIKFPSVRVLPYG